MFCLPDTAQRLAFPTTVLIFPQAMTGCLHGTRLCCAASHGLDHASAGYQQQSETKMRSRPIRQNCAANASPLPIRIPFASSHNIPHKSRCCGMFLTPSMAACPHGREKACRNYLEVSAAGLLTACALQLARGCRCLPAQRPGSSRFNRYRATFYWLSGKPSHETCCRIFAVTSSTQLSAAISRKL